MVTKDVYNHAKNGLDISNTPSYIQYADLLKKIHENVSDLTSFLQDLGLFSMLFFLRIYFLSTSIPVILFPETLLAAYYPIPGI